MLDLAKPIDAADLRQPEADKAVPATPPAPTPRPVAPIAEAPLFRDPPVPPVAPRDEPVPTAHEADAVEDAFAPAPPFRPRRNPARLWTIAAVCAALVLTGGVAALQLIGTPTWLAQLGIPLGQTTVPLLLEMPRKPHRRTTPSGNELFELSGRVINPTTEEQRVPDILVELSDPQGRVIYGWTITPAKRTLAPRETLNFDSAQIDVPKGAKSINFLFAGSEAK